MEAKRMGLFIKALRKEKDLTQEQLAESLFVSSKTVSRWETGSALPDLLMLQNIADFFGVDIRELIDGERYPEQDRSEEPSAARETVRKMTEYSTKKEKRISRKLWMIFGLILLGTGSAAAALLLKHRSDELNREQNRSVIGEAVSYLPAEEGQTEVCLLCEDVRVVRVLVGPETKMDETLKKRIDTGETGLKLQAYCVYTQREEKAAGKAGRDYAYPAVSLSAVGALPILEPEWSPETPRKSLLELQEGYAYTPAQAEYDGCVVMSGASMVHGEMRWLEFLERIRLGKPSVIRIYQQGGRRTFLLKEMVFDGSLYQLSYTEGGEGNWSLHQDSFTCLTEELIPSYEIRKKGYLLTDHSEEVYSGLYNLPPNGKSGARNDAGYSHCYSFLLWSFGDTVELERGIYGWEFADVDGDDRDEKCFLCYGWTSGLFTFSVAIYGEEDGLRYYRDFGGEGMRLELIRSDNKLYVQGTELDIDGKVKEIHQFEIAVRDGQIELLNSEKYFRGY